MKNIKEWMDAMARLSDIIEEFLKQLICDMEGSIEIQRNELANRFNCVPSQINYVIDTRFTKERGYFVESKRGGGGHIRIRRVKITSPGNYIMHIVSSIGENLSQQNAEAFINNFIDYGIITSREALIVKAAISDRVLSDISGQKRDEIRANILKNVLINILV